MQQRWKDREQQRDENVIPVVLLLWHRLGLLELSVGSQPLDAAAAAQSLPACTVLTASELRVRWRTFANMSGNHGTHKGS